MEDHGIDAALRSSENYCMAKSNVCVSNVVKKYDTENMSVLTGSTSGICGPALLDTIFTHSLEPVCMSLDCIAYHDRIEDLTKYSS